MAEAVAELRVVVDVEGLVEAAAHGPEEAGADVEAAGVGLAEVREEDARRALVLLDGIDEVRDVEGGHVLHPEDHVLGPDLVVDLEGRREALKLQRGLGWVQDVKWPSSIW